MSKKQQTTAKKSQAAVKKTATTTKKSQGTTKKQEVRKGHQGLKGTILILGAILIGLAYQLIPMYFNMTPTMDIISVIFNAVLGGLLAFLVLRSEFIDWFKHFSFKWLLIGIVLIVVVGIVAGYAYQFITNMPITQNAINGILSWDYLATHIPLMLLGEEILSLSLLYGAWKKWGWNFWIASIFSAILFGLWHLVPYNFNYLQILFMIVPIRLVLNYLFKKSKSIWVTWITHFVFDMIPFLIVLLNIHI